MGLVSASAAVSAADRLAFNAWAKGKHDDLVCPSHKDLVVQLAAKHKGATADGLLVLLQANPQCHKVDAGIIRRVPRCELRRAALQKAAMA